MHPLLRSKRHLLLAWIIWMILTAILAGIVVQLTALQWGRALIWLLPPMILLLFLVSSSWYMCRLEPLRVAGIWRVLLLHFISAALITVIWWGLVNFYSGLLDRITEQTVWEPAGKQVGIILGVTACALYLAVTMFHYLFISMEQKTDAERRLLEENLAVVQTELRALRNTIHPHFLFNTLTALSVLSREDPERTRLTLLNLSDFLRYSMRYQQESRVPLIEEIGHIRDYLAVETLRLGDRLKVEFDVDPEVEKWPVLSLTLLPVVENAIKHGIQTRLEGGNIRIEAHRREHLLRVGVINPAPPEDGPRPQGEGMGLTTLQRRLQIVYKDRARLEIHRDGEKFITDLYYPAPGEEVSSVE